MTDLRFPCAEGNADDWFIGRDGKQYPDEELLNQAQRDAISDAVMSKAATEDVLTIEKARELADATIARAEADERTASLGKRRRAKSSCFDCLARTDCLDLALRDEQQFGTWGGYYEEELRTLRAEIQNRKTKR